MSSKQHTTRVSAGLFQYRVIKQPGEGTRPVAQRTRQAIFNVLGDDLVGLRILDLFAGSGALGFEALSRGADSVVFVEYSSSACHLIRDNAEELGVNDQVQVIQGLTENFCRETEASFDIIFLDPPYADFRTQLLEDSVSHLSPGGVMIASCGRSTYLPDQAVQVQRVKQKVYGDTKIGYYK